MNRITNSDSKLYLRLSLYLIGIFIGALLWSCKGGSNSAIVKEPIRIGAVQKLDTFEIKVYSFKMLKSIVDPSLSLNNYKAPDGALFAVVDVGFTNIDKTSRQPWYSGAVFIQKDGVEYEYDQPSFVGIDGYWGRESLRDLVNPLIEKRMSIAFPVPKSAKGPIFWLPGWFNGQRVLLDTL